MRIYIESVEKGVAKTGNEFYKVNCVCEDRQKRQFYLWDGLLEFDTHYSTGVRIMECMFGGDANFPKITSFTPANGDVHEFYSFIFPSDEYSNQVLDSLIGTISDEFYLKLIHQVFNMQGPTGFNTVRDAFIIIPAAKAYHHDYRYGLIKHTHEVMTFVSRVYSAEVYQGNLDKDTLLTGALLHDVGKCFEYSFDGVNTADYGTNASVNQIYLASHLYKGAELISLAYQALIYSDPNLKTLINDLKVEHLKHIVVSHHLQREWAAISKEPQTLEAYLCFLGDYYSAAHGKFESIDWKQVSQDNLMGQTSKYNTFFGFTPLIKKLSESENN